MGVMSIEFPCGMVIKSKSWLHYFDDKDLSKLYVNGCPLHGKECPMGEIEDSAVDEAAPTTDEEKKEVF